MYTKVYQTYLLPPLLPQHVLCGSCEIFINCFMRIYYHSFYISGRLCSICKQLKSNFNPKSATTQHLCDMLLLEDL